jgi:hypothetical protein
MMLRQEGALDRSIDRKVRILLALRREFATAHLPGCPGDQGHHAEVEEINTALGIDIPSGVPANERAHCGASLKKPQASFGGSGTAVIRKVNERTGNVIENKGMLWKTPERSWNVYENKEDRSGIWECC